MTTVPETPPDEQRSAPFARCHGTVAQADTVSKKRTPRRVQYEPHEMLFNELDRMWGRARVTGIGCQVNGAIDRVATDDLGAPETSTLCCLVHVAG